MAASSALNYLLKTPTAAAAPAGAAQQSVARFQNQQLGGLTAGTSSKLGAPDTGLPAASQTALGQETPATIGQRTTNAVRDTSANLLQSAQAQRQRLDAAAALKAQQEAAAKAAAQQAQQAQQLSAQQGSYGQSSGSAGNAYTPDGSLSGSRNKVLNSAMSYVKAGTPYVLGGTSYRGIDCSGLVMEVYNQLGYNISQHSSRWQGRNIPGVRTSLSNLRPGDIVAWKDGSHIAIYAGNGNIIEAAKPGTNVRYRKLWAPQSAVFGIALHLPGE